MGIGETIKQKLGERLDDFKQRREREKNIAKAEQIVKEHTYRREYGKARLDAARKEAQQKAKADAQRNRDPIGYLREKTQSHKAQNRLGDRLTGLGDFGRSIGQQYENMPRPSYMNFDQHTPSWLRKKKG